MFNQILSRLSGDLVSRRLAKQLIRIYGGNAGHNLDEKKGTLGYALLHYALIQNFRPDRVLCIGSQQGFVPAILALACRANGEGQVDFVDAGYNQSHPDHWGGIGLWRTVDPAKHFGRLGLSSWITTYVTTSGEFAKRGRNRWQYIYIDGDHSYEGVRRDHHLFWPRLDEGGLMVFHDILLKEHPEHSNFGVWRFWREVKSMKKITIPFTHSAVLPSGLGILQK